MTPIIGAARVDPAKSVFINCPFDDDYEPLFNAIFFAAVCCGFVPRSALEWSEDGGLRIERIMKALDSSKYSIHDLSRCRGEGDERLARFNMPLELGMAMALGYAKKGKKAHRWLALVPEGHLYHKFISDLSGYDLKRHDSTEKAMVQRVVSWLIPFPGAVTTPPPPPVILAALPQFQEKVKRQKEDFGEKLWGQMLIDAQQAVPRL